MVDRRSRAALFALDALEGGERARVERLIPHRPRLAAEIEDLQEMAAYLSLTTEVHPRPALRPLVLGRIHEAAAEASRSHSLPTRVRTSRRRWVAGLAAAVVVVVLGVGTVGRPSERDRIAEVLAAADATTVELRTGILAATFTYSPELERGVFVSTDLSLVGVDETYQLWFIDEAGPMSAGVFVPDQKGGAVVLIGAPQGAGTVLGLTVEPAPGAEQPTGEILLAGPVS